ncbi:zinc finger HIT domain-containing protein 2 [Alosa sapidissima]|uniref:zinc finger HIT domain-containing protein 2 n=1 Tax=Alosa sapidissima TaxID=34773 RepID=UPI001C0A1178|nr:zinc finger HIT domain-containing protein 2 [Alosa sapidissima]XP_041949511.1 zinc finger HIT domain-containing protein 2 [Alosa sapidissima]XP_041949512.1 zinc finger HIT domain-containing protein 2 [Alosa sapidissima]
MDCIVRRKLPSRVRSMLTDIRPREQEHLEEETEPELVDKDGLVLPGRGAIDTSDLLTPAVKNDTDGSAQQVCGLCLSKPYCYTCPRCNIMYCSLACYRSPAHSGCSEEFYKESVLEELKNTGLTEKEGREKMQEILLRVRKNEGELEHITEELGEEAEPSGTEALELLSRLAEIQTSGEENTEEIQKILLRLRDIDEGADGSREDDLTEEEGDQDLADKLAGLDIDSLSEEELWALLSRQDREKFQALVKGCAIGGLIPIWRPWWEIHDEPKEVLLEVMSEDSTHNLDEKAGNVPKGNGVNKVKVEEGKGAQVERTECVTAQEKAEQTKEAAQEKQVSESRKTNKQKNKGDQIEVLKEHKNKPNSNVPPVNISKIPALHSLTKNPSPLLGYTLINVLYGYTFSLCLFNGDISEEEMLQDFCRAVLAISDGLSTNRVLSSLHESLDAAVTAVSTAGYFDREDPRAPARAVEAVAHVLTGQSGRDSIGYSLAALSELRGAMSKVRGLLSKEGNGAEPRKKYFQAMKKCEFLQAWAKENSQAVDMLAAGVWREHLRREGERRVLEEDKKGVEKSRKKGRGTLIEEVN